MSRKLTEDETNLWKQETALVRKKKTAPVSASLPDATFDLSMIDAPSPAVAAKKENATAKNLAKPAPKIPSPESPTPLTLGNYAGVDAATVRRIKRGQLAVSARVDLHGMTQAEAYESLNCFLKSCVQNNKRLVLVITGKGRRSESRESGVLKTMLPMWLQNPELRPHILAFDTAQIQHGGSGAFYILLKRNRLYTEAT